MMAPFTSAGDSAVESAGTVEQWIRAVAEELGTADFDFAGAVLRAWLHMLRNRLTSEKVTRFAAELPVVMTDFFFEDWDANSLPVKGDAKTYTIRFARAVRIAVQDVSRVASATTVAVLGQISVTGLEKALEDLAPELRTLIAPPQVLREAC